MQQCPDYKETCHWQRGEGGGGGGRGMCPSQICLNPVIVTVFAYYLCPLQEFITFLLVSTKVSHAWRWYPLPHTEHFDNFFFLFRKKKKRRLALSLRDFFWGLVRHRSICPPPPPPAKESRIPPLYVFPKIIEFPLTWQILQVSWRHITGTYCWTPSWPVPGTATNQSGPAVWLT